MNPMMLALAPIYICE